MGRRVRGVRTPTCCLSAAEGIAARNCEKSDDANFDSLLRPKAFFLSSFSCWKVMNDSYVSLICSTGFLTGVSNCF